MLKIRFRRQGRIHQPFYRIVVTENTAPVQGNFIDQIGHYDPKSKELKIDKEKAIEWMNKGAKPSNTVAKLMKKEKISHKSVVIEKFTPKKKEVKEEKTEVKEIEETPEQIESTEDKNTVEETGEEATVSAETKSE